MNKFYITMYFFIIFSSCIIIVVIVVTVIITMYFHVWVFSKKPKSLHCLQNLDGGRTIQLTSMATFNLPSLVHVFANLKSLS